MIEVFENGVDNWSGSITEWPAVDFLRSVRCGLWGSNEIHDDGSCQPERCNHEPGEEDGEDVVEQLNMEEEHPDKVVATLVPGRKS